MKSFLVDALRQADGDDNDPADNAASEPESTANTSTGGKIELPLDAPSMSEAARDFGSDSSQRAGDFPDPVADESSRTPVPVAEANSLQLELSAPDTEKEFSEPVLESQLAVEPANDDIAGFHGTGIVADGIPLSRYERMIRLLPLGCLVAFGIGAVGQLALNRMTYADLNADLSNAVAMGSGSAGSTNNSAGSETASSMPVFLREATRQPTDPIDERQGRVEASVPAPATRDDAVTPAQPVSWVRDSADSPPNDAAYPLVESAFNAYQRGAFDVALADYESALLIEPNHREALSGLAAVYQKLDQAALALPVYEKLLLLEPGNVHAASEVLAIRSRERGWQSESEIRHLIQRFPEAHRLHFSLANLLAERGRWADARHAYYQAYSLAPGVAEYSYNLAVSLEALGDLDTAINFYKEAVAEAGPDSGLDREVVQSRLKALASQLGESS